MRLLVYCILYCILYCSRFTEACHCPGGDGCIVSGNECVVAGVVHRGGCRGPGYIQLHVRATFTPDP